MDIELCTYNSLRSVRIALFSVLQERFHSTVLKRVHGKPSGVMCTPVHYSLSMVGSLCTSISVVVLPIMRFVLLSTGTHIRASKCAEVEQDSNTGAASAGHHCSIVGGCGFL